MKHGHWLGFDSKVTKKTGKKTGVLTLGPECPVSRKVARTMGHIHLFFLLVVITLTMMSM